MYVGISEPRARLNQMLLRNAFDERLEKRRVQVVEKFDVLDFFSAANTRSAAAQAPACTVAPFAPIPIGWRIWGSKTQLISPGRTTEQDTVEPLATNSMSAPSVPSDDTLTGKCGNVPIRGK